MYIYIYLKYKLFLNIYMYHYDVEAWWIIFLIYKFIKYCQLNINK